MTKLEQSGLVTRIAQSTGVQPEKVAEVVQLALEGLHRIAIVDEEGPTAAVMEACFSFGDKAAFHLIGLYVSEHDYHGRGDDAGIWNEVAMRFIPSAYAEGCDRMAPWFRERTPARQLLDADIREHSRSTSKHAEQQEINSSISQMSRSYVMMDGPGPFSTLATWEQHLKDVKALPDSALNKRDLIASAERWIDFKRQEVANKAIKDHQPNSHKTHPPHSRLRSKRIDPSNKTYSSKNQQKSIRELRALARKHWEEWLPKKVNELRADGKLNEELHAAAVMAQTEIEHLMKSGYSVHEAREVALPMFILLPPGPGANVDEEEREELAEKEREYQKNPPVMTSEDEDVDEPIHSTETKSQPISTPTDHTPASSTAPKPRSRPLSDLEMDDMDTEAAQATLERLNKERKAKGPRRPNVGMIFGRMVRRVGRDSGDAQLAKAGQDLIRRSYEEAEESEPDLASLQMAEIKTQPVSASTCDAPAPNSPEKRKVLAAGKIDGGVSRWVKEPDGSSKVETWEPGKGWVPGKDSIGEVMGAPPVSPALASRLGIPPDDLP
jgi:hypothetical protein